MSGTRRTTVKVTWRDGHGERRVLQKERRFGTHTPARVRKDWAEAMREKLKKRIPAAADRAAVLGTLKADAARYYPLIRHLADWVSRRSEIRAWLPLIGDRYRHTLTREDVLTARGTWKAAGVAHRSINNRVSALKDLYKKIDGDDAATPCDGVRMLTPPRIPMQRVNPVTVNVVLANLLEQSTQLDRRGRPLKHAKQDRARLMVVASTGKRPCEIERAKRTDVNLEQRVWGVRDAKGGWSEGVYLNDEMLIAWQAYDEADAWELPFGDKFAHRLRRAGWPAGVDPYCNRHSAWIAASELGADLADIQIGAGHRNQRTTREHYVPVLNSRMQRLSELIDNRFGWVPAMPPAISTESDQKTEPIR